MESALLSSKVTLGLMLFAWLGVCVFFDLRSRQVPALLTVFPLLSVAAWRLFQGGWKLVLLVVALTLISDFPQVKLRIPLGCTASIVTLSITGSPDLIYAALVIFAVWAMWETGATGGADAKIIMTLVLVFANGLLFVPIVLAGGLQGMAALIARRKTIPYTISIALGTTAWLWMVKI